MRCRMLVHVLIVVLKDKWQFLWLLLYLTCLCCKIHILNSLLVFCEAAGTRTCPVLRDLSFPLSHIINPVAVSCLANRQPESLQSWGTSWDTLLPPSSSSPPSLMAHVAAVRGETMGKSSSKDTLHQFYILFCSNLFSGGCEVKVQEIRTHFSFSICILRESLTSQKSHQIFCWNLKFNLHFVCFTECYLCRGTWRDQGQIQGLKICQNLVRSFVSVLSLTVQLDLVQHLAASTGCWSLSERLMAVLGRCWSAL